jgi:hypothetical protein
MGNFFPIMAFKISSRNKKRNLRLQSAGGKRKPVLQIFTRFSASFSLGSKKRAGVPPSPVLSAEADQGL